MPEASRQRYFNETVYMPLLADQIVIRVRGKVRSALEFKMIVCWFGVGRLTKDAEFSLPRREHQCLNLEWR